MLEEREESDKEMRVTSILLHTLSSPLQKY